MVGLGVDRVDTDSIGLQLLQNRNVAPAASLVGKRVNVVNGVVIRGVGRIFLLVGNTLYEAMRRISIRLLMLPLTDSLALTIGCRWSCRRI